MNRTRVERCSGFVTILKVLTSAGFVTQTPHYYRGVVAVAKHHAVDTVYESGNPTFAVGDRLIGMVFQVCFITGVETVVVKHRIHTCRIGIVRRTDGIDIVLLHQEYVLQHRLCSHRTSVEGMRVVAVHALEEDTLAVDIDNGIFNLDVAETILRRERHFFLTRTVLLDNAHGVKVGRFSRPCLNVFKTEFYGSTIACEACVKESVNNILLCHFLTLGVKHLYRKVLLFIMASLNGVKAHFHLHCSILVISRKR